jgi:hypothetical protein
VTDEISSACPYAEEWRIAAPVARPPDTRRRRATGSWPLKNIQLANALKTRGYDFHFRFGTATRRVTTSSRQKRLACG